LAASIAASNSFHALSLINLLSWDFFIPSFHHKSQRKRWDISRGVVAAIEGQVRCVTGQAFPWNALLPK